MLKAILCGALLTVPNVLMAGVHTHDHPAAVLQASQTHDGKVVSVAEGKLVMSDKDGKNQHSHVITATAKITLGGKSAKLVDLKTGDAVKVTMTAEGVVTMVEATRVEATPVR